jgi:hypothetical protein
MNRGQSVCVCVCVCARGRLRVRGCVRVHMFVCVGMLCWYNVRHITVAKFSTHLQNFLKK